MTLERFLVDTLGSNVKETQKLLELSKEPDLAFVKNLTKKAVELGGKVQEEDFELVLGIDLDDCCELQKIVVATIELFFKNRL